MGGYNTKCYNRTFVPSLKSGASSSRGHKMDPPGIEIVQYDNTILYDLFASGGLNGVALSDRSVVGHSRTNACTET